MMETRGAEVVSRGRTCSNCKAFVSSQSARFCEFCGAELPPPPEGARPHTPHDLRREVFVRLREHPQLEELLNRRPAITTSERSSGVRLLVNAICLGIAGLAAISLLSNLGTSRVPAPVLAIMFMILCLFAFFALSGMLGAGQRAAELAQAEIQARPCVLVDERVHVSGGGNDTAASTQYFATLEDEQGNRQEYPVSLELASLLVPNDAGVAYFRRGALVSFERVSA